jgi:hypothetical protein
VARCTVERIRKLGLKGPVRGKRRPVGSASVSASAHRASVNEAPLTRGIGISPQTELPANPHRTPPRSRTDPAQIPHRSRTDPA